MRRSPQRHVLAVLRLTIGLGQAEMAKLCDCSKSAIQRVELGHMPLSAKLGARVAQETGIGSGWLLANEVKAPLVDQHGSPYTKNTFEKWRARQRDVKTEGDSHEADEIIIPPELDALREVINGSMRVLARARRAGEVELWAWKLKQAVSVVDKEWSGKGGADETEADLAIDLRYEKKLGRVVLDAGKTLKRFSDGVYSADGIPSAKSKKRKRE